MTRHTPGLDHPAVKSVQLNVLRGSLARTLLRPAAGGAQPVRCSQSSAPTDPRPSTAAGLPSRTDLPGRMPSGDTPVDLIIEGVNALWAEYLAHRGRRERDALVVHYTALVRGVAGRLAGGLPSHVDLVDLVQSGVFGLLDAIERFDPARCPRFESYAAQRIRGAMLDELRAQDWVPRTVRGRTREVERVQERLEGRLGRGVTDRELATELGMTPRELRGVVRHVQLVSVEALDEVSGRDAVRVSEMLADDAVPDPMAVVQRQETSRQLDVAVGLLGERDRLVVRLYYVENRTLAEIGRVLGVTESRVCQLHARLVVRLRGWLEELATG